MAKHNRSGQSSKAVVTPEGWIVTDPTTYRFLTAHTIPRPYGLIYPLRLEGRSWVDWMVWGFAVGPVALGLTTGLWLFIPIGLAGVAFLLWLYLCSARAFR